MKKTAGIAMLLLILLVSVSALAGTPDMPEEMGYVWDFDGFVLNDEQISEIAAYGFALEARTGDQVIAVIVDSLDGMDSADYAMDLMDQWGIGASGDDNGAVVLLAVGDQVIEIRTGNGINRVMSASVVDQIIDNHFDALVDGDYGDAVTGIYEEICENLADARGMTLQVAQPMDPEPLPDDQALMRENAEKMLRVALGALAFYMIVH